MIGHPDLIHIPIKLQVDIPNSDRVIECQEAFTHVWKNSLRGITYSSYKRGTFQSLLYATCQLDINVVHSPIQLDENIMKGY